MKRFIQSTRGLAAGLVLIGGSAHQAAAQFAPVNYYQQGQPAYSAPAQGPQATAYATPPRGYPTQPQGYSAPPQGYQAQQGYQPPQGYYPTPGYQSPRVAQAGELPSPAEAINGAVPATPSPSYPQATAAPSAMPYEGGYEQPVSHQQSYPTAAYSAGSSPMASSGCATGNCGGSTFAAPAASSYGSSGCDTGCYQSAPACDVGCYTGTAGPQRQWFGGLYGLYMARGGDQAKAQVAYLTDTAGWTEDYYPMPTDTWLNTGDLDRSGMGGAEVRFGSTFGCDPCACNQPFAWEVGYWGLDTDSSSSQLILPGTLAPTYTQRLYSLYQYQGLNADLDGAGTTWSDRPIYIDDGMPADDDQYATDVRLLGVRVRQRFSAQNLELNFWRFGTPTAACGGGRLQGVLAAGQAACGYGGGCSTGSCSTGGYGGCDTGSCGGYDACGGCAPCAPCRPPRRFFINGLLGVRYLRVDDDFGLDQQFAVVDVPPSGNAGNVPVGLGWTPTYTGFPSDSNQVIFSDFQADNELVGFQLGSSMNWLIGCRWNLFADGNFGIYGNNAEVTKRVYGGGASYVSYANGGGAAYARGSETSLAYVGELRAGVGYQVTCNCRLTAAYRFIGIGGVALGVEEYQNTYWANAQTASHIDTNNSIILHGLQTGVEYKY